MQAFKRNKIDTNWLDGLIRERAVRLKYEHLVPKNSKDVPTDSFPKECGVGMGQNASLPKWMVQCWKGPILLVHLYPMLIFTKVAHRFDIRVGLTTQVILHIAECL